MTNHSNEMKPTWAELFVAGLVGVLRQVCAITRGSKERYGSDETNGWQKAIEGAIGEQQTAKYLNRYWPVRINSWTKADIGDDIDAKTTGYHDGRLTLHKESRDDWRYYLVTKCNGKYIIRGWMWGRDGKNVEKYWDDPSLKAGGKSRPAFYIPQSDLRPPNEL